MNIQTILKFYLTFLKSSDFIIAKVNVIWIFYRIGEEESRIDPQVSLIQKQMSNLQDQMRLKFSVINVLVFDS